MCPGSQGKVQNSQVYRIHHSSTASLKDSRLAAGSGIHNKGNSRPAELSRTGSYKGTGDERRPEHFSAFPGFLRWSEQQTLYSSLALARPLSRSLFCTWSRTKSPLSWSGLVRLSCIDFSQFVGHIFCI